MSKKIEYCNSYLASITEVGRNFDTIAEVKTKSMLNNFEDIAVWGEIAAASKSDLSKSSQVGGHRKS